MISGPCPDLLYISMKYIQYIYIYTVYIQTGQNIINDSEQINPLPTHTHTDIERSANS